MAASQKPLGLLSLRSTLGEDDVPMTPSTPGAKNSFGVNSDRLESILEKKPVLRTKDDIDHILMFFQGCNTHFITLLPMFAQIQIARFSMPRLAEAGEVIHKQDTTGTSVAVIFSGTAAIYQTGEGAEKVAEAAGANDDIRENGFLGEAGVGFVIGENLLVSGHSSHLVTAQAVTPVRCLVIHKMGFINLQRSVLVSQRHILQKKPVDRTPDEVQLLQVLIGTLGWFNQLTRPVQLYLAGYVGYQRIDAGEWLCEQGEPGDTLYVLLKGTCDVYQRQIGMTGDDGPKGYGRKINHLVEGMHFGETALYQSDGVRSASVQACEPLELVTIDRMAVAQTLENENFHVFRPALGRHALSRGGRRTDNDLAMLMGLVKPLTFFTKLSTDLRRAMMKVAKVQTFQPGEVIARQGIRGSSLYVVLSGAIHMYELSKKERMGGRAASGMLRRRGSAGARAGGVAAPPSAFAFMGGGLVEEASSEPPADPVLLRAASSRRQSAGDTIGDSGGSARSHFKALLKAHRITNTFAPKVGAPSAAKGPITTFESLFGKAAVKMKRREEGAPPADGAHDAKSATHASHRREEEAMFREILMAAHARVDDDDVKSKVKEEIRQESRVLRASYSVALRTGSSHNLASIGNAHAPFGRSSEGGFVAPAAPKTLSGVATGSPRRVSEALWGNLLTTLRVGEAAGAENLLGLEERLRETMVAAQDEKGGTGGVEVLCIARDDFDVALKERQKEETESHIHFLFQVSALRKVGWADLASLLQLMQTRDVVKGDVVVRQGDELSCLYLVRKGHMHLEVAAEASMVDAGAPNLARDMLAFGARSEAANSAPHAAGRLGARPADHAEGSRGRERDVQAQLTAPMLGTQWNPRQASASLHLAQVGPTEFFNEGVISDGKSDVTVVAASPAKLFYVSRADLARLPPSVVAEIRSSAELKASWRAEKITKTFAAASQRTGLANPG
eukprot:CAMPEP_0182897584 /NCGR_PEP_ID=MMETSP0034_2-20130328/26966_1 /TAXON_ID=156128 /ORGANISM="Nephroselmis pyriformis, Strain CCMP717" /LENGTH=959 /DNA_ID=CAMNT_0025031511 /DNA_START=173 /DNA_END=3048 /DNA_ORIENTATION=+